MEFQQIIRLKSNWVAIAILNLVISILMFIDTAYVTSAVFLILCVASILKWVTSKNPEHSISKLVNELFV